MGEVGREVHDPLEDWEDNDMRLAAATSSSDLPHMCLRSAQNIRCR